MEYYSYVDRFTKIYPFLKGFTDDLLFFIAIDTLFFTIVKGLSVSEISLLTAISSLFAILGRLVFLKLISRIGNTVSVRIGMFLLLLSAIVMTLGTDFWVLLLGKSLYEIAFIFKDMEIVLLKNNLFNLIYIFLIIPILIYLYKKNKLKNNYKKEKQEINFNLEKINNEINLLNENKNEKINELNYLEKEIENKIKKELIIINLNTDNYNQIIYNEEIEEKINLINKEINEKELEEHKLELDKQNIFPKIDRLANIQEELEYSLEEYNELKNNSEIIDIAKEYLEKAYKNMKENVTPKFSKELSQTISNISDGKYKNMKITDNDIMVEVENGNYVSASQLSEGTIEQLYFSLRMAILKEISNETLPIFLDESFVFFDKNRLINTINYLNSNHDNQIIIFSCTEREKDILDYLNIKYNLITL